MAIVNWNIAFEATPAGSDSPDTIDDRIRELKENVRERVRREHEFDYSADPADQGWHRIGSAKIYVGTTAPTQRPGNPQNAPLDADDTGRMWFNTTDERLYCWNGSAWIDIIEPSLFEAKPVWSNGLQIGTTSTLDQASHLNVAVLNETKIALVHDSTNELRTYTFNGDSWSQLGNGLAGGFSVVSTTALNDTDIALIDTTNAELRTYRFDGTNWALIGFGLSIASASGGATITALNETDIAYCDFTDRDLKVYRFDGTNWSQIGNSLSISMPAGANVTALSDSRIAFVVLDDDELRCYDFDGTNWSLTGSALNISFLSKAAALNDTDVVVLSSLLAAPLTIYRFDGSAWSQVGYGTPTTGFLGGRSVATLNGTDVALFSSTGGTVGVFRFSWALPTMRPHALSWV